MNEKGARRICGNRKISQEHVCDEEDWGIFTQSTFEGRICTVLKIIALYDTNYLSHKILFVLICIRFHQYFDTRVENSHTQEGQHL